MIIIIIIHDSFLSIEQNLSFKRIELHENSRISMEMRTEEITFQQTKCIDDVKENNE
jgi:hypothetical protein